MNSLQEAKSIAEAMCTESTNKYRKTSRFAIRVVVVVIALSLRSIGVTELITEHRQKQAEKATISTPHSEIPLASSPQSTWPKLVIPAGGRSELIPPIAGKHPEVTGVGKFSAYAVREDDTVCEADEPSCVNGPFLKGYYVTNESDKANTYTVVFK